MLKLHVFHVAILTATTMVSSLESTAQTLGTVTLPADLADPGVQVIGVLNRDPLNSSQFLGFCEGPSVDGQGNVYFTEGDPKSRILKVTPSGTATVFAATANLASNGTEFDAQGRLVVCQTSTIASYDGNGNRTVLSTVENISDNNPSKPNDLTIGSNGAMYFSNWGNLVYYRSPNGQTSKFNSFQTSNGIEWVEERKKLYLSQDGPDQVWIYDVAMDGTLSNGSLFVSLPEPDGITVDEKGNIYIASWANGRVHVYDSSANSLGSIQVNSLGTAQGTTSGQSGNTSNCVIGHDKKLYITGDGGLYSVQLKVGPRRRPGVVGLGQVHWGGNLPRLDAYSGSFNPSNRPLSISFPGDAKNFSIKIFDMGLREVWRGGVYGPAFQWNGHGTGGQILPSGRYIVSAFEHGRQSPHLTTVDLIRQ